MIDHWQPHWWSTKYIGKYSQAIKKMEVITRENLLEQLNEDFGIRLNSVTHKEAADLVQEGQKNHKDFEEAITKVLENRAYELDESKRLVQEYFWRARIMTLFPFAKARILLIKSAEDKETIKDYIASKPPPQQDNLFTKTKR